MKTWTTRGWALGLALAAQAAAGEVRVLCTTYPIYQLTRQVTAGQAAARVELLLPAALGCPHHYALTPQDMQKLARADVLVVNGQGMEEFLGAPVQRANAGLAVVDSSAGVADLLRYEQPAGGAPFEWAGAFQMSPGVYSWSFAQREGRYADPGMKLLIRASTASGPAALARERVSAQRAFMEAGAVRRSADELQPAASPFALEFDLAQPTNTFRVHIERPGTYVFFTEHLPTEFESGSHYFKDSAGRNVEPVAQEPQLACCPGDEDGAGHDHAHHHHHAGVNPHLFVSPRLAGQLAANIAAGLARHDPAGAETYQRNARALAARLNALADAMAAEVKTLRNNRIVQPHGIFDYLARDIGLEIVAVTQPHGQEPSAAELLELVRVIRERAAGAVITEPQYSPKVGQLLARETGIPVAELDPMASGPEDAPLDHYESVMRRNLETLRATLGVRP